MEQQEQQGCSPDWASTHSAHRHTLRGPCSARILAASARLPRDCACGASDRIEATDTRRGVPSRALPVLVLVVGAPTTVPNRASLEAPVAA